MLFFKFDYFLGTYCIRVGVSHYVLIWVWGGVVFCYFVGGFSEGIFWKQLQILCNLHSFREFQWTLN